MQLKKEDEIILVASREKLFENVDTFQGSLFRKEQVDKVIKTIEDNYKPMRRGSVEELDVNLNECAERNEAYKQPIPYIVIQKGNQFYVTERLEGGGESRLHGKLSMGIGGHMNPIEGFDNFEDLLLENTLRELHEELYVEDGGEEVKIETSGLINDDVNEVGKVHIGLLGRIKLSDNQDVSIKEVEQLKGTWYTLDELFDEETFDRLEAWGQIVVEAIGKKIIK